jgi:predicted nucleic acid-binding protein
VILLDTSGLLAALDGSQPHHSPAVRALESETGPLILSPFVLAELDHLLATRVGRAAQLSLLGEVEIGVYDLPKFTSEDVARARSIIERFADHDISLADASIVVLADRVGTVDVLTLDERHFRVLQTSDGRPFSLLPSDR